MVDRQSKAITLSETEYLAQAQSSLLRHEYINGQAITLADASYNYRVIADNLYTTSSISTCLTALMNLAATPPVFMSKPTFRGG